MYSPGVAGRKFSRAMTEPNGWRPFALDTAASWRTWACTCGAETSRPGLEEWQWRWLMSADPRNRGRARRGGKTESQCKSCAVTRQEI